MTARPLESLSTAFFAFFCSFTYFNPILLYFSCNLRTARWLQPNSDNTAIYPRAILFFSDTDNCCRILASTQHKYNTCGNFLHVQFLKHRNRGNNERTQNGHSGGFILHQNSHAYYALSTASTFDVKHTEPFPSVSQTLCTCVLAMKSM